METAKYVVVPFISEHLSVIAIREPICVPVGLFKNYAKTIAFTGLVNGNPVACGGIRIFEKIGYVWAFVDISASNHIFFVHRTTSRFLNNVIQIFNLQRVQAFILPGFSLGQFWAERLGFEYEGIVRCIGINKEDYKLYARIMR